MPLRLLRYMIRIWDRWLKDHLDAKAIPVIVPVVLAHADGGWRAPVSMHELYALPDDLMSSVASCVPQFRFVLDDLSERSDEELMTRTSQALGIMALLLMRHVRDEEDPSGRFLEWNALSRAVWGAPDGRAALGMLVRYLVVANKRTKIQNLVNVLVPLLGEGAREVIMTEGQRLIEQGRVQGRAEGEARGEARGRAAALLAIFAARGLPVSTELRSRIAACTDVAQLDRWVMRAATAASAADALSEA